MKPTFDKKWFNPLYFILNQVIQDHTIRTVLVYGGKSSAKTVSLTQILQKEMVVKEVSSIGFRKESSIIPTTLKKSFNLAIETMYLQPVVETQDRRYLNRIGASEIILKGLDDSEKAKGVESYKYLYLDELNHFLQEEYEQFNLSLRGIAGQKIFASWNPVDENSWVKTELVDKYEFEETDKFGTLPCENSFVKLSTCGKVLLIKTTYQDNYWIVGSPCGTYGYRDENLIAEYEGLRTKNYNSYKVNVLGEWGKTVFGGEFLKCWKSELHTGLHAYDPAQAIWLSFDENVNPYFPCGFFQVGRDLKTPRMIHQIAAKNPNKKVSWVCREIERVLNQIKHKEALFITGDATSQKEDVKLEKGDDMFRLITASLQKFRPHRVTPRANPSVRMSADFFNSLLEGNIAGMTFAADNTCRIAISDFENTKEDKNGKVDKSTVKDPKTGITYQPYGHFVDLTRYFLVTAFPREYSEYQRGGNMPPPISGRQRPKNDY
jgi:phage terminase large subunit